MLVLVTASCASSNQLGSYSLDGSGVTDASGGARSLRSSGGAGIVAIETERRPVLSLIPLSSDESAIDRAVPQSTVSDQAATAEAVPPTPIPDPTPTPTPDPAPAPTPEPAPIPPTVPRPVIPEATGPTGLPLVIFDSDLGPDVDDALALAMLHAYQKRGAIEIAAVTLSRNSPTGARYADALNTFYGRPDIPIGVDRGDAPYFSDSRNFVALASQWPHDLTDGDIEEAYRLHRKVMVRGLTENRPVVMIQVGFSGNLSRLVDSGGDDISPKSGSDLIRESVSVLSVMGGSIERSMVEFNVENDVPSAQNLFAKWPGRLILSPFELGYSLHYPYSSIQQLSGQHLIRQSYEFRDLDWHHDAPPFYNMRTWDLTAVMEAVEPASGFFFVSQPGKVTVDGSGRTFFNQGGGQHYVLDRTGQYSDQQRNRILARMVELVSEAP